MVILYNERKEYYGVIIIGEDRYMYMSIRQLQDIVDELKEEAKHNPECDAEHQIAYKALQDKIRERDRHRPKCIPTRFEHELDLMEEF